MTRNNVIIIGAARSGTNMLRDILASIENYATWPCDEINYIWRHGLKEIEHDAFDVSLVNSKKIEFIRQKFDWIRQKYNVENVIEKTCANSLRVDYVDGTVSNAKYVFIFRDPYDVVSSAEIRWKAKLDVKYTYDKAKFVPISDLPFYATNYFFNRIKKFVSKEGRLSYWGPKYIGFEADAKKLSALEISAKQWLESVKASEQSFLKIENARYISVDYNAFVQEPKKELHRILSFLDVNVDDEMVSELVRNVSSKSIGKGRKALSEEEHSKINDIVGNKYDELKRTFIGDV